MGVVRRFVPRVLCPLGLGPPGTPELDESTGVLTLHYEAMGDTRSGLFRIVVFSVGTLRLSALELVRYEWKRTFHGS